MSDRKEKRSKSEGKIPAGNLSRYPNETNRSIPDIAANVPLMESSGDDQVRKERQISHFKCTSIFNVHQRRSSTVDVVVYRYMFYKSKMVYLQDEGHFRFHTSVSRNPVISAML